MLVQEYARESNMALIALATSDWRRLLEYKIKSENTAEVFESTHKAFINGGEIILSSNVVAIPAQKDPAIVKQLESTLADWQDLKREVLLALRSESVALKGNEHLVHIQDKAEVTVDEMDRAVLLIQAESQRLLESVHAFLTIMLFGGVFTFFVVLIFVDRRVMISCHG